MIKDWFKIPREQRRELRKAYKEAGIPHTQAVREFEEGGPIHTGSLPETEVYAREPAITYPDIPTQIKLEKLGYPAQEIDRSAQWINDWMGNRKKQVRRNTFKLIPPGISHILANREVNRMRDNIKSTDLVVDPKLAIENRVDPKIAFAYHLYDPATERSHINFLRSSSKGQVPTHELTHAMSPSYQERAIHNIIGKHKDHVLKSVGKHYSKEFSEYLSSPNEVYANLMEIRRELGLNPKTKYKHDDVPALLKSINESENLFEHTRVLFNSLPKTVILRLLNTVADNSKPVENVA